MTESKRLRALADFIEANPWLNFSLGESLCYVTDKDTLIRASKMPGARKSFSSENWYNITVPFCPGGYLTVYTQREKVCTAIRTERVIEPEKIYDKVVEWECTPLLKDFEETKGE